MINLSCYGIWLIQHFLLQPYFHHILRVTKLNSCQQVVNVMKSDERIRTNSYLTQAINFFVNRTSEAVIPLVQQLQVC